MSSTRVVITGLGAVSPVGNTIETAWKALLAGQSGVARITQFDASDLPVQIAGEVKHFVPDPALDARELKRMGRCVQLALNATLEAVRNAGLDMSREDPERVGVVVGTGAGAIELLLEQQDVLRERGARRVAPLLIANMIPDAATGHIAIVLGAQGPNMAVVSACATGGHAIGEAWETLRRGDADVIIAGGTEAAILPVIMASFTTMRGLASNNEQPERACRPFDADRDGFILSEGAAILVLETLEHALERGAPIIAEVVGYGSSNDAYHMAASHEQGAGSARAMRMALRKAGLAPEAVDYINAHGTGTPLNDAVETLAIKQVFGDHAYKLAVSSTKSMTGHMMGAAGAFEAVVCALVVCHDVIPPTINYETPDPACDLDYVPNTPRHTTVRVALSNSIGLGGHNSALIVRKFEGV